MKWPSYIVVYLLFACLIDARLWADSKHSTVGAESCASSLSKVASSVNSIHERATPDMPVEMSSQASNGTPDNFIGPRLADLPYQKGYSETQSQSPENIAAGSPKPALLRIYQAPASEGVDVSALAFKGPDLSPDFHTKGDECVERCDQLFTEEQTARNLFGPSLSTSVASGGEAKVFFGDWDGKSVAAKISKAPTTLYSADVSKVRSWLKKRRPSEALLQMWVGDKNHVMPPMAIIGPDGTVFRVHGKTIKESTHRLEELNSGHWIVIYPRAEDSLDKVNQKALFQDKPTLTTDEVLSIARQATKATIETHKIGVAHRDIKPHNYLVKRDSNGNLRLYLADFGMAALLRTGHAPAFKSIDGLSPKDKVGTLYYASRNQLEQLVDIMPEDIRSLGDTITNPRDYKNKKGEYIAIRADDTHAQMVSLEQTLANQLGINISSLPNEHVIHFIYNKHASAASSNNPNRIPLNQLTTFARPVRSITDVAESLGNTRFNEFSPVDQSLYKMMATVFRMRSAIEDPVLLKKSLDIINDIKSSLRELEKHPVMEIMGMDTQLPTWHAYFYTSLSQKVLEKLPPEVVARLVLGGGDKGLQEAWFSKELSIYKNTSFRNKVLKEAEELLKSYPSSQGQTREAGGELRRPINQIHIYPVTPQNALQRALDQG